MSAASCTGAADAPLGPSGRTGAAGANPQCLALPLPIHSTQVRKDGIPALSNPTFVEPSHPDASYVTDTTRVVGVVVAGTPLAVPLNVLWWHEVVNLSMGGAHVAVTYCPLTGSSLVFDRLKIGGRELRVSGLLYDNNLIMFDANGADDSLWAQMLGRAICGPARGTALPVLPSLETSFAAWRSLHPDTRVTTSDTGFERDYRVNPYADYWRLDAPPAFESRLSDPRRPPKELVLGIPDGGPEDPGSGGIAVPFLDRSPTAREVLHLRRNDEDLVVFWDGPGRTAAAFRPFASWPPGYDAPSEPIGFRPEADGYRDEATGSLWTVEGEAVEGPAAGARLLRHPRAFVAFWFAWSVLRPDLEIFTRS